MTARGTDDVVVATAAAQAEPTRQEDARDRVQPGPRIVQWVNAETGDNLLVLCGGNSRPALSSLALDDQGRTWSLERDPNSILREGDPRSVIWRRLWVPPLPNGDGDD